MGRPKKHPIRVRLTEEYLKSDLAHVAIVANGVNFIYEVREKDINGNYQIMIPGYYRWHIAGNFIREIKKPLILLSGLKDLKKEKKAVKGLSSPTRQGDINEHGEEVRSHGSGAGQAA